MYCPEMTLVFCTDCVHCIPPNQKAIQQCIQVHGAVNKGSHRPGKQASTIVNSLRLHQTGTWSTIRYVLGTTFNSPVINEMPTHSGRGCTQCPWSTLDKDSVRQQEHTHGRDFHRGRVSFANVLIQSWYASPDLETISRQFWYRVSEAGTPPIIEDSDTLMSMFVQSTKVTLDTIADVGSTRLQDINVIYHQLGWLAILDGKDYSETRSLVDLHHNAEVTTNADLSVNKIWSSPRFPLDSFIHRISLAVDASWPQWSELLEGYNYLRYGMIADNVNRALRKINTKSEVQYWSHFKQLLHFLIRSRRQDVITKAKPAFIPPVLAQSIDELVIHMYAGAITADDLVSVGMKVYFGTANVNPVLERFFAYCARRKDGVMEPIKTIETLLNRHDRAARIILLASFSEEQIDDTAETTLPEEDPDVLKLGQCERYFSGNHPYRLLINTRQIVSKDGSVPSPRYSIQHHGEKNTDMWIDDDTYFSFDAAIETAKDLISEAYTLLGRDLMFSRWNNKLDGPPVATPDKTLCDTPGYYFVHHPSSPYRDAPLALVKLIATDPELKGKF